MYRGLVIVRCNCAQRLTLNRNYIAPETAGERREELRRQRLEYCKRDTLATVRIWQYLTTMK